MFAFVFRRMMDFDQMFPVAVALSEAGYRLKFGVMGNALDIADDPRLRLLTARPRIVRLNPPLSRLKCALFLRNVSCLVMDWVPRSQSVTGLLTSIARRRGIPSISLPHGVDHAAGTEYYTERLAPGIFDHFDHVVVPNDIRRQILTTSGMSPERIHVLGSPRFTSGWVRRLSTVFPPREDDAQARLKVVFFEQTIPERFEQLLTTLERLSALEFIELAIQAKPIARGCSDILGERFPTNVDSSHASALCAWCDVVIGTSSTVIFEALTRGKHLFWARHLDIHQLAFETLGGVWIVDSDEELEVKLRKIAEDKSLTPPDATRFKREILWGRHDETDVLPGYLKLLESAVEEARP